MTTIKPPSTTKWRKVALISGSIIFGPIVLAVIYAALSGPRINSPAYEQGGGTYTPSAPAPVAQAPAAQPNRIGALARESELMGPMPTDPVALHQWLDRQCEITMEMQDASANAVSAHEMGRPPYCTVIAEMNDELRANGIDPDSL
jgi:hypothetical protein